jgi:hypothetical protein
MGQPAHRGRCLCSGDVYHLQGISVRLQLSEPQELLAVHRQFSSMALQRDPLGSFPIQWMQWDA